MISHPSTVSLSDHGYCDKKKKKKRKKKKPEQILESSACGTNNILVGWEEAMAIILRTAIRHCFFHVTSESKK